MANRFVIPANAWDVLVVVPVKEAVKKKFKHDVDEVLQDVLHATAFVLKSLRHELKQMIQHVAYTTNPTDFASMVIIASAAPKTVYKTLCQTMPAFVKQVVQASGLPVHTTARMQTYFASLGENSGNRLALMFIRDAVYISCPSNRERLAEVAPYMETEDIARLTKMTTLAMCSDAIGTHNMDSIHELKIFFPTLIRSMESPNGCLFICRGDSMCNTPPTVTPVSRRLMQIKNFMGSIH